MRHGVVIRMSISYAFLTNNTLFSFLNSLEHSSIPWMNRVRYALLDKEDVNLIITDWSKGAKLGFDHAVGNVRLIGAQVAELIRFLVKNANTSTDLFYIVGFSLGAHIAGDAGSRLKKDNYQPIGRITGKYSGTSCKRPPLMSGLVAYGRWSLTGSFTNSNLTDGGTNRDFSQVVA